MFFVLAEYFLAYHSNNIVLFLIIAQIFDRVSPLLSNLCLPGKMEPVAFSASIIIIISITQDFTRFVQAITNVEDSNLVVRYQLIAQKKSTDAWANRMRISNEDVIRTKIPREE